MHVSMSEAWDEAQAFVRREAALLLPLGLATVGMALLVYELVVPEPRNGSLQFGPWVIALLPIVLLILIGSTAISALALRSRLSVGEALARARSRLGTAILLVVALTVAVVLVIVLCSIVGVLLGTALGWSLGQVSVLTFGVAMPVLVWLAVRVLPLWALVADRDDRPMAAIRHCFALTRGSFWRLFGVSLLFMAASAMLSTAIQFAFGSILLLLSRAIGSPALGPLLVAVLMAVVGAVLQIVWIVYVATIYRRLEASSGM